MYVVDKENSIMDYVKQIKTVAAPDLQIRKQPIHKFHITSQKKLL